MLRIKKTFLFSIVIFLFWFDFIRLETRKDKQSCDSEISRHTQGHLWF